MDKIRRTWVYVHQPYEYEMSCDVCGGSNLAWSEFEGFVWCYDCKMDTPGDKGIFDGPVSVALLGMFGLSLDRVSLETGRRQSPIRGIDGHMVYADVT